MLGEPKSRQLDQPMLVSLDGLVPQSHFYRHLERTLDLTFVREFVRDSYADIGRPSIDPVVFFKLQLILFFEGLRSERQLMRVVADRLSLRWYLGYDLTEALPDHSSLTRIRERYGVAVFRRFFEVIVEQCMAAGLVWGKELFIDSTDVEANASLDSLQPRFAVEAHLARLFTQDGADADDGADDGGEDADQDAKPDEPICLPVALTDEARADLADRAANRHDWIGELGRPDRTRRSGSSRRTADYRASTTDPDASPLRPKGANARLGYHDHYVVDGGKARIILTALVTPAEVADNQPAVDLLWRTRFRWKLHPRQVTGDTKVRDRREHCRDRRSARACVSAALSRGPDTGALPGHGICLRPRHGHLPLSGKTNPALQYAERANPSARLRGTSSGLCGLRAPCAVHDLPARTENRA